MRGRVFGAASAAIVLSVTLAVAFRGPVARALVAGTFDVATGYRVDFSALSITRNRVTVRGLRVARGGQTLLEAATASVDYRAREFFAGGTHRYGLTAIVLQRPRLWLRRRADGTLNIAPSPAAAPNAPGAVDKTPLRFLATLRGGRVDVVDPYRALADARHLAVDDIDASLAYDGAGLSTYRATAAVAGDPTQRLVATGRFDERTGFASHRLRGDRIAVTAPANYFIDSASARFVRGVARAVELRYYAFPGSANGPPAFHLAGSARLEDGAMRVPGLLPTATRMHGRIDVFDGGLATPKLAARIGGLDLSLAGVLYDWSAPAFRLGISAPAATFAATRALFAFSQRLPLTGDVRLATFLEGAVGSPLVATRISSPALTYGAIPAKDVRGRAIYYKNAITVVGARGSYDGLDVRADGNITLGTHALTKLALGVAGPARRLPFLAQIAPAATVHLDGLLAGAGLSLDARGVATGSGGGTELAGVFHVDRRGDGSYGPVAVRRADGSSLTAAFYPSRSASASGLWLVAHDFAFAQLADVPRAPGLTLVAPQFSGRLDGALAGVGPPSDFRVAGVVRGRDLQLATVRLDAVRGAVAARFTGAGRAGEYRLGNVDASGPWGTFVGSGAYAGDALALDGRYRGSFERLAAMTGQLGASGPIDGPVALLIDPKRTLVQARGNATAGAVVRGVPLDSLAGTLSVEGKRLHVYAASARVAGGTMVAAGTLESPQGLGVSLAGARTQRVRTLLPLGGDGRLSAIGRFDVAGSAARFNGGLAIGDGATLDRLPFNANGEIALSGSGLAVRAADLTVGAALGSLAGSVTGLGTRRSAVDVGLHLAAVRVGPFARAALPQRNDVAGTLEGDVRISGPADRLALAGKLRLPEGTVNGLAFRDASATVGLDRGGASVHRGTVTVGSTRAGFGAVVRGNDASLRIDVPHADLADFNDYFDTGDTLAGRGRLYGTFVKRAATVRTRADIALTALRFRRFDLGDAVARWSSRGAMVTGTLAFGGASGRLETAGTLALAASAPLNRLLERSRFRGSAHLRGLDLGVWLPAVGYQIPVAGRVDADATIVGPLGYPDVRTDATLRDGSIGKFPVDSLVVSAASTLRRTTVRRLDLELPALSLVGSGSFGLRDGDPLALALHAKSTNLAALATSFAGAAYPVAGSAEMDVKVAGTPAKPRLAGGFDFENASLHGVAVPRGLGQFSLDGRDIVLSSVEVGFATGALFLAGSVPLQVAPFGLGSPQAPLSLELSANGIDLANFAPLLPRGSSLRGKLDGRIAVGGTAGSPRLDGQLALANGALASPFETVPLTDLGATVLFSGNEARIDALHAAAGGGTLDGSGTASFPSFVHPGSDVAYRFSARSNRMRLNLPAYGLGTVDGTLTLKHAARAPLSIGGNLALSDATIPFAALLLADSAAGGDFAAAPTANAAPQLGTEVAFDLMVAAQRNVRVRSSNVDIGARGELHVGGTLAAAQLKGRFDSTGGTLTYVNTVFRLVDGRVTFEPDLGLIPTLVARASTHVINPDPNTVRNVAGTADVSLDVSGPVTNLTIGLSSDPPYDRQQILGLLFSAPALGASNLFGDAGAPTPYGSSSLGSLQAGNVPARASNGQVSVAQEAFGIANAQFTRTLLAPIETSFAEAVGLSNFNVNVDYTGNVGLSARKVLGKKINAVYGTSFGYPYRQTFGFEIKPNDTTAAQITVFQTLGASGLNSLTPATLTGNNLKLQAAQPAAGTVGFSLSLQRLYP